MQFISTNSIDDAGLDLTMTEEHYAPGGKLIKTIELEPGGGKVEVNDSNKRKYLTLLARYRLGLSPAPHKTDAFSPQVKAFVEGFYSIIPEQLMETFNEVITWHASKYAHACTVVSKDVRRSRHAHQGFKF